MAITSNHVYTWVEIIQCSQRIRLLLLARFLYGPMIHVLLTFVLHKIHMATSSYVSPSYSIYWIAAHPMDNVIHPLNNWGLDLLCHRYISNVPLYCYFSTVMQEKTQKIIAWVGVIYDNVQCS